MAFATARPRCWRAIAFRVAPAIEHYGLLRSVKYDLLIDVGANRGQFSLLSRVVAPSVPIRAFEPIPAEAARYRRVNCRKGESISLMEVALGDQHGVAELHLSGRADSSSMLPIGELQSSLFPGTEEVGILRVPVTPLDALPEVWAGASRALLKLDVQGFEMSVLRGAREALRHCQYVYVECSHVPLYVGQALFPEVNEFLKNQGFVVAKEENTQFAGGKLIQADYLFSRIPSGNCASAEAPSCVE